MNTLAIDLYKQAIITAYQMVPKDPANPMTHTFEAVVAGTLADLIVAECIALREKIKIVGINSEVYKRYFTGTGSAVDITFPYSPPENPEYVFVPTEQFPNESLD